MTESKPDQSVTTSRGSTAREPSTRSVPATAASTSTQTQNNEEREKQRAEALARELSELPKTEGEKEADRRNPLGNSEDRVKKVLQPLFAPSAVVVGPTHTVARRTR